MPSRPLIIVDITDPELTGILESFGSSTKASPREFTRYDGNEFDFQFVERTGNDRTPYEISDLTGYTIQSAIGELDDAPTAGTFDLAYDSNSTGLTGLVYNITGSALQTALNANAAITTDGGVTVTQFDNSYQILFNTVGDKDNFTSEASALIPECYASLTKVQAGSASVKEIWWLRLVQKPLAYTNTFVAGITGSADVTVLQAGTSTLGEVQRISLDLPSYDGAVIVNASIRQEFKIFCVANTAHAIQDTGFLCEDSNGTVGVSLVETTGTPPAEVSAADRVLTVSTIANGDSATSVATKVAAVFEADSEFTASSAGNVVTVRQISGGTRIDPTDVDSTFTFSVLQDGIVATNTVNTSASAQEMAAALGNVVNVSKTGAYQWDITFPSPGDQDTITVDASALFQTVYTASLSLSNQQTFRRFASEDPDTDTISVPWEISITPSGGLPVTVYRQDHNVSRDVITPDVSASTQLPTSLTAVRTTNTVFVDAEYGSDSGDNIGLRERLDRPFQTPEAAESAAVAQDIVYVRKASYALSSELGAKSLTWVLEPNTQISSATSVFIISTLGTSIRVKAGIDATLVSSGDCVTVSSASTFKAEDVRIESDDSGVGISCTHASGTVTLDRVTVVGIDTGLSATNGTVTAKRSRFQAGAAGADGISKTGGTMTLIANELIGGSGGTGITGSGTVIAWNNILNLASSGVTLSGANNTVDSNLV